MRLIQSTCENLETRRLLAYAVSGVVWKDADYDSAHDSAESHVAGVRAYVDYNNNQKLESGEPSGLTNTSGAYRIDGVKFGGFPVRVIRGTNWNQSWPFDNAGHWVNTTKGDVGGVRFGLYRRDGSGGISGQMFVDMNGDGDYYGDESPPSSRILFVDYDNDKRMDSDEPRALSLPNGRFQINHIKSGSSRAVRQILPESWEQTAPVAHTYDTTPPVGYAAWTKVDAGNVSTIGISSPFGSRPIGSAGEVVGRALYDEDGNGKFDTWTIPYRNVSITGVGVWVDYDDDGMHDSDEPYPMDTDLEHPGWGIGLPTTPGQPASTNVSAGCYQIRGVRTGRWPVRMSLMSGWKATTAVKAWVTVKPDQTVQAADFLAMPTGSLGSITTSVFADLNRDGKDNDWSPDRNNSVVGAKIFIDLDRINNDFSQPEFNDPVQNTRYYSEMGPSTTVAIVDLPAGKYRLRCILPYLGEMGFWANTTSNPDGVEVTVKAGADTTMVPGFGLYPDWF